MDQNPAYSDRFRGLHYAQSTVAKQQAPEPLRLIRTVDRQPAENGHWNWLRHVAAKAPRSLSRVHATSGDRIVAGHHVVGTNHECP